MGWGLVCLTMGSALAQDVPSAPLPPIDGPVVSRDRFNAGRGVALGGLGVGLAGNLLSFAGNLAALPEVDQETGTLTPQGFQITRPYKAIGGIALHGTGAPLMAAGTLQMRRANAVAGVDDTAVWGSMGMGFGIASLAANTVAFVIDDPNDAERQLTASTVGVVGILTGGVSYSMSIVQYVLATTHRPARREPVNGEPRASVRAPGSVGVVPTANGAALVGRW